MVFANEEHEKFYYEKLDLFKTQAAGTQKQAEIKENGKRWTYKFQKILLQKRRKHHKIQLGKYE